MGLFNFFKKKDLPKTSTTNNANLQDEFDKFDSAQRQQTDNYTSMSPTQTTSFVSEHEEQIEYKNNEPSDDYSEEIENDYAYVRDIECCEKCAPYRNRYYCISGADKRFPKLPDFFSKKENIECCGLVPQYKSKVIIDTFIESGKRGDIISISNRPFVDDRTEEDIVYYKYFKFVNQLERHPPKDGKYSFDFDSGLTSDGKYDFTMLTDDERTYIETKLEYVRYSYSSDFQAIGLMYETKSSILKPSYILNSIIVIKYCNSENPLDIFAVAKAYERMGANFRKKAIEYNEKFLKNPVSLKNPNADWSFYRDDLLHNELSELYEKDCQFDKALEELEKAKSCSDQIFLNDITRKGDILIKISVDDAVKYYTDVLNSDTVSEDIKQWLKKPYNDALEKQQKGYVYKPRKSKPKESDLLVNEQIEALARQFI